MAMNMMALMTTISRSSKRVTLLSGSLMMVPRHAHWNTCLLSKLRTTPMVLMPMTPNVTIPVTRGWNPVSQAMASPSSTKG